MAGSPPAPLAGKFEPSRLVGWRAMRRYGRTAVYGVLLGLATVAVAEAVRPRGGTSLLLDWDEVRGTARARLLNPSMDPASLAAAARSYRSLADNLEKPLLDFVGPLPKGASMPKFAAHPWLRPYMESSMKHLIDTVTRKGPAVTRFAAFAGVLPAQWRIMRQVQGTMSVVEGYSNLVMNNLGVRLLPGFDRLEKAYRERSSGKSALEVLIWKLTGLDLKLQQYRRGEAFCQAVYGKHGLALLNRVWDGPDSMPTLNELGNPEAWYRRTTGTRPPAARRQA